MHGRASRLWRRVQHIAGTQNLGISVGLELIRSIQKERGISVIYITHDLGVVAKVADYVDVMYAGKIVETGTIDEIFYDPKHPYTWGLLSAMPDLDTADDRLYTIPGSPPNLLHEKPGDAFRVCFGDRRVEHVVRSLRERRCGH